ncbi:MAG: hypothetical protein Q4F24_06555 [Eubacteriales bacterium]|nr:hypothetical protein [Eubacteriales bacterium]
MNNNKYVITISYDDYTQGTGGTDKVILSQQMLLNNAGYDVVHISPYYNLRFWNLLIDGEFKGIYSNHRLKALLYSKKMVKLCAIFIHHLKNIQIDLLDSILDYCDVPIFYYLHDYYTICPKSGLIKEDGMFCGNGFPTAIKCRGCSYFDESGKLVNKIRSFLKKYENRITFIAPSESAKNVWIKDYPQYADKIRVIYHQKLSGEYIGNRNLLCDEEPLKIGFVGYQKPLKGWKQFKEAVKNAQQLNLNETFYQFGWGEEKLTGVEQVDVDFKVSMTAMIDALRCRDIDIAVIWSTWPETYAYTYYEALAANCFVLTNHLSGNVCCQIQSRRNGVVGEDLKELLSDEKKLRELINNFRTNGHQTPSELKENEKFLNLITDFDGQLAKVRKQLDISLLLSIVIKTKRKIGQHLKREG